MVVAVTLTSRDAMYRVTVTGGQDLRSVHVPQTYHPQGHQSRAVEGQSLLV